MSRSARRALRAQRRFERIRGFVRGATGSEPQAGVVRDLWQQVPRMLRSLERTAVTVVTDGATRRVPLATDIASGGRRPS